MRSAVALTAVTVLLLSAAGCEAQQRPVRTICSIPAADLTPSALHVKHTVEYYASRFTNVEFRHRLLGNGDLTTRNFVAAWAVTGATQCDAMIGPGFSFLAIAMSPVINVPWVDFSATSVELSDKAQHPYFSRIIPTDEVGARAASLTMLRFGWKRVSIFCVDDAYGRSVAGGVSADLIRAGGGVDVQRCLPASTTRERVEAALDDIASGGSRVVFGAMLPTQATYRLFIEVARERQLADRLIFFFSEAMCSLADRSYASLPGSLCATYTMNPAIMDPFIASYWRRDVAAIDAELRQMGLTDNPLLSNSTDIYAQLAHDATLHTMSGMDSYVGTGATGEEYLYIRNHVSTGATGEIRLDASGDRLTADAVVFNSRANSEEVSMGFVVGGNFSFAGGAANPAVYFLGQLTTEYPAAVAASATTSESDNTLLVVLLAVLIPVLLIVSAMVVVMGFRNASTKTRDNAGAPKDGDQPFSIVFTDIQGSTNLWAQAPVETSDAIEQHHKIIRTVIAKHRGYEVKTVGDAFMVAFKDAQDAVEFALGVQVALYEADWGPGGGNVDRIYRESLLEKHPDEHEKYVQRELYDDLWCGIRVRIGCHFGLGDIKFDEVSLGYDYYGTVVNTAARIEAVGHGGQICASQTFVDECGGEAAIMKRTGCLMKDMGVVQLRGLQTTTHLYELLPDALSKRVFPPLRLDVDFEDVDATVGESEGASMADSASSSAASGMLAAGGGDLEKRATRHAKSRGLTGQAAHVAAHKTMDYHAFLTSMLSTSKPKKRAEITAHLATKWRIPLPANAEVMLLENRKQEEVLLAVAAKTLPVFEQQHKPQLQQHRRPSQGPSPYGPSPQVANLRHPNRPTPGATPGATPEATPSSTPPRTSPRPSENVYRVPDDDAPAAPSADDGSRPADDPDKVV